MKILVPIYVISASVISFHHLRKQWYYQQNHFVNNSKEENRVIIIGGGIIGISQALKLLKNGEKVTLLEAEDFPATKCSAYNGNIYSPSYYVPLVTRDNLMAFIVNKFKQKNQTTLQVNNNVIWETNSIQWFINALLLSWTDSQVKQKFASQFKLGQLTEEEFNDYKLLLNPDELTASNQIVCFKDLKKFNLQKQSLIDNQIPHQVVKLEDKIFSEYPYLLQVPASNFDTRQFTLKLLEVCKTYKTFDIQYKQEVQQFIIQNKKVIGVQTNKGPVFGDAIILCNAHKSKELLKKLKVNLPILPAKGWCMGIQRKFPFLESRTIYTPNFSACQISDKLRLSCCLELCNDSYSDDHWGAEQILNEFNRQTDNNLSMEDFTVRTCNRPLTPDDVCVISSVPGFKNVFVNAGHGSRGMSYCFGAAEIMYQVMQGREYPEYSINRFYF